MEKEHYGLSDILNKNVEDTTRILWSLPESCSASIVRMSVLLFVLLEFLWAGKNKR